MTTTKTPLLSPPLTSVLVVLRATGAGEKVAALPHAGTAISDSFDYGLPQFWSLPRACENNGLSLLHRLVTRGISHGVDPHYWRYQYRLGLVSAVQHDNLAMVEWLHDVCPSVLPYHAMIEAATTGNLRLLQWLATRHNGAPRLPQMMDDAASSGQLAVLQYLHNHSKNVGCTTDAFASAVRGGHIGAVKWILDDYPRMATVLFGEVRAAMRAGHSEVVRFVFNHRNVCKLLCPARVQQDAAEQGNLEMV
ncbi:hypothetical protein Gpo141_00013439 [Globisporangium polare]